MNGHAAGTRDRYEAVLAQLPIPDDAFVHWGDLRRRYWVLGLRHRRIDGTGGGDAPWRRLYHRLGSWLPGVGGRGIDGNERTDCCTRVSPGSGEPVSSRPRPTPGMSLRLRPRCRYAFLFPDGGLSRRRPGAELSLKLRRRSAPSLRALSWCPPSSISRSYPGDDERTQLDQIVSRQGTQLAASLYLDRRGPDDAPAAFLILAHLGWLLPCQYPRRSFPKGARLWKRSGPS